MANDEHGVPCLKLSDTALLMGGRIYDNVRFGPTYRRDPQTGEWRDVVTGERLDDDDAMSVDNTKGN